MERVQVICPACGQQVEAVARDGQVTGYCGVAKQHVNFEIQLTRENRSSATELTQVREGRDSRGHFVKGNVPWNKRLDSPRVITFTCRYCYKPKPMGVSYDLNQSSMETIG